LRRDYIVIIWPTGYKYKDEMYEFYRSQSELTMLTGIISKTFESAEGFMSFIYDVYKNDDLSRDILDYKSKLMVQMDELNCGVFLFSYSSNIAETDVDPKVLAIKTNIRNLVAAKMDNYYYDILIHATDTSAEYDNLLCILTEHNIEFNSSY